MTEHMQWALIGASNVANEWMIDAIRSQPSFSIKSVLSSDAERGTAFARKHHIPHSTTHLSDILEDPDIHAVYISTHNAKHYAQAMASALAGKHILCEKPLALTLSEASSIIKAAQKSGVVFGTNHHLRCSAVHQALRQKIHDGSIGQLNTVRVFHANFIDPSNAGWRVNSTDGGLILDSTIHDIDTLRFLLGSDPTHVFAMSQSGRRGTRGVEDGIMAVLRFPGDLLVQIHGSYAVPSAPGGVEVFGETGALIARDCMSQKPIGSLHLRNTTGEHAIPIVHHNLYYYALERFRKAIIGQDTPAATGQDGRAALHIALALKTAIQTGRQVEVHLP
ncbi:Gfo/Idh/MocA family protein [Neokomagataea thailandica]|uniref:Oxidoreductase n=1 Tax=Neokomagataea tanensis NBRC 106556 TaxID=1223519 RepID=A0ABQ0QI13_9PROT|nr:MULTISPECIES: Gfo/Idh/MocA family oxidoreductase [Neokomagataea]GBR45515.1 oxidoreductase [Neokomagataea tanensis NBRC 106556]